ncbi:MAG: hypothetical protein ABI162_01035 [Luteolibacter sp.]
MVISILVILMTAGVSLLNGTSAQSRKAATDMLGGLIDQARTTATISRTEILMVIAEPGDLPFGDERSRVGLFRKRAPVEGQPDKYDLLSRWQLLNTGVILIGGKTDDLRNPLDEPKTNIVYGPANREVTINVHAISISSRGALVLPKGSDPIAFRIAEGAYRSGTASPNTHDGGKIISENRLKIGRVTARPYRID